MSPNNSDIPYGTLDLMVLKTLAGMGPLHGYGIARRIEQARTIFGDFLLRDFDFGIGDGLLTVSHMVMHDDGSVMMSIA
jgi:hypothetical protein